MTPATPHRPFAPKQEPLVLPWDLRLSPEQFERVCQANPEAVLELAADGQLIAAEAAPLFPGLQIELAEVWAG